MRILVWPVCLIAAAAMVSLAIMPLGFEAQLAIATASLVIMTAIKVFDLRGPFRAVFLAFGIFVILRYVVWRLSSTVPSTSSPADFVAGVVLVCAELYCVLMLFLSLFTVADPIDTAARRPDCRDEEAPTVDVFVPSYNESIDILAPTLAAAKRMSYPAGKLNVFLLDDGGTDEKIAASDDPESQRMPRPAASPCKRSVPNSAYAISHASENRHAKAGNLNNGLAHSDGELVAVFDADHAPARSSCAETVGFFERDEKLFLVQTPHFFLNPDPIEKNIAASACRPRTRCSTDCPEGPRQVERGLLLRFGGRAAASKPSSEVGGFQGSSITEDAESALELHARGWNSLYVDKPMIAGLQPETFESFIGQRSRWCRGMVQILLLKNPLFKPASHCAQRLCYLSSSMFWLFPLSRMTFIFAPMLFIFFDMKIYVANWQEFMAYTHDLHGLGVADPELCLRSLALAVGSDVYEYVQSVMLFRAVLSVFLDPRRPKFNVTAKGQSLRGEPAVRRSRCPYFAIFGLVAASMGVLVYRYLNEPERCAT